MLSSRLKFFHVRSNCLSRHVGTSKHTAPILAAQVRTASCQSEETSLKVSSYSVSPQFARNSCHFCHFHCHLGSHRPPSPGVALIAHLSGRLSAHCLPFEWLQCSSASKHSCTKPDEASQKARYAALLSTLLLAWLLQQATPT